MFEKRSRSNRGVHSNFKKKSHGFGERRFGGKEHSTNRPHDDGIMTPFQRRKVDRGYKTPTMDESWAHPAPRHSEFRRAERGSDRDFHKKYGRDDYRGEHRDFHKDRRENRFGHRESFGFGRRERSERDSFETKPRHRDRLQFVDDDATSDKNNVDSMVGFYTVEDFSPTSAPDFQENNQPKHDFDEKTEASDYAAANSDLDLKKERFAHREHSDHPYQSKRKERPFGKSFAKGRQPKQLKPMKPKYLRDDNPAPEGSENWESPWAQMRTYCFNPCVFPAMVGAVSEDAKAGDWVKVYDREGTPFGAAIYNPKAKVPLRVFVHGDVHPDDEIIMTALDRAITLRQETLGLNDLSKTNAYRVVNSDGDGLSGLIVDRYANVLSIEIHSLGIFQRLRKILDFLHSRLGTEYEFIQVDERVQQMEGIRHVPAPKLKYDTVKIIENGVHFEVDFSKGHKTGFFCDQRDNRLRFSNIVKGKRVLDLCCYTGGFSIMAACLGDAADITGVDLDENAIAQAKRNANINGKSDIHWIHADAYSYARQMQTNGEKWDVVLLDPPKFVENREEQFEGYGKYEDLNKLGMSLLNPGGTLVTCSCSGLVSLNQFEDIVVKAAHRTNRRLQFFARTSAGGDHPIYSNCPESRYLKVLWTKLY